MYCWRHRVGFLLKSNGMEATNSFRSNWLSNIIAMSDWLCRNCKIQWAMMLTNRNELQGENMIYILTAIRERCGVWSSDLCLKLLKRLIDERWSWNEQGQLCTDWLLKEFCYKSWLSNRRRWRGEPRLWRIWGKACKIWSRGTKKGCWHLSGH